MFLEGQAEVKGERDEDRLLFKKRLDAFIKKLREERSPEQGEAG